MKPILASTIAAICRERDERFKDSLPLVQQVLSEYGEHDLANRLFAEIPRDVPFEVVADLFDLILHSGNENCSEAIARSIRSWLRQGGDTRRMSLALRLVEKQGTGAGPARPGRHHRLSNVRRLFKALGLNALLLGLFFAPGISPRASAQPRTPPQPRASQRRTSAQQQDFLRRLSAAAIERTQHQVRYDPGYQAIAYPGGDVPQEAGVCTDEVIRVYRALGIDLQKEVHEDMAAHFSAYPSKTIWRLEHPDANIDHRRVPNLMVFFHRNGQTLPITNRAADYQTGDLVTWDLGHGLTHIGMVVDQRTALTGRPMIVHNIGQGPKMEDVLFDWKITGHYRYFGPESPSQTAPAGRRSP